MNKAFPILEKSIFNRDIYRSITLVICLLYFMPSTLNITNFPMKVAFIWGVLIVLYEFFIRRTLFKMRYASLLILAILSFCITVVLNRSYFLIPSIYNLGYLLISLVVIFPSDDTQTTETKKSKIYNFNLIFIFVVFTAATVSIIQFLLLISYHVPTGTPGLLARQGFLEHRLFGIYTSPNVGAIFGYCSIILSLLNVFFKKMSKPMTLFLISNFIIQILYLIISSSRGGQLVILSFLILFVLLFLIPKFRDNFSDVVKINNKWTIGITVLLLLLLSIGSSCAKNLLSIVPTVIDKEIAAVDKKDKEVIDQEKVVLEHSPEDAELSAGRFTIWKAAIKSVEQSPVFGFGETDFYGNSDGTFLNNKKLTTLDKNELKRAHGNMHNGYLQVLVSSGIVGFFSIYIFYAFNVLSLLKQFFVAKRFQKKSDFLILGIILIFMITLFVDEMVEAHLLFNKRDVISIIFWYYLGYLSSLYLKKEN
ncbi:O-antigen ligase family protein [Enterococcus devriesei]|uniref:O-antigen ligase family protein n=1 Tax=Enterococcus devriesei TaxID=319970 RepID=UPI002890D1CB|nr:O-antigen ligase family protein [Enterococcus devriesei]MDT2820800.1 O-antigen ligase family protein [Enterococcus devriesei]